MFVFNDETGPSGPGWTSSMAVHRLALLHNQVAGPVWTFQCGIFVLFLCVEGEGGGSVWVPPPKQLELILWIVSWPQEGGSDWMFVFLSVPSMSWLLVQGAQRLNLRTAGRGSTIQVKLP